MSNINHTWSVAFAISLLAEAGYKATMNRTCNELHIRGNPSVKIIYPRDFEERVASADIRHLLDNPSFDGMIVSTPDPEEPHRRSNIVGVHGGRGRVNSFEFD